MESSSSVPRLYNCCFVFSLRSGVLTFAVFEAIFWLLVTIAAIYSEVRYMLEIDLYSFTDYIYECDWYYYFVFWHPRDDYTETLRTNIIVLNLLLALFFLFYFIFTVLLIIGIFKHSKTYFIPYLLFDVFFLIVTILLGIVGTFFRLQIAKLCVFFFFVKIYSSLCAFSLYKDYRSRKKVSDKISIHSGASQHLTAIDADGDDEEGISSLPRNAGLGEAPLAVAV